MNIKDLEVRQGNVDITVEVVDMGEVREFQKFGRSGRVCNATVKDETGEIKLTLWNEDIDKVKAGSKVKLTNGYVNEFQGEKQLTTGKFGKLEVEDGDGSAAAPAEGSAPAEPAGEGAAPAPEPKPAIEEKPVVEEEKIE